MKLDPIRLMPATPTLFQRILVPHDFSEPAIHALTVTADLAVKHGGKLTVLCTC